jgi:putative oxidoreductase
MRALFLAGRALFGGFFAYNGINHFQNKQMMTAYAESKGVPPSAAETAIPATGAMLLAGGLSVVAGARPKQGLAAIVGFLIPVTLQMHRFWEVEDPQQRMNEMVQFTKNVALVGAALMMLQIPEPWPISVDEATAADEEMFVHLGGRDLRSLPA